MLYKIALIILILLSNYKLIFINSAFANIGSSCLSNQASLQDKIMWSNASAIKLSRKNNVIDNATDIKNNSFSVKDKEKILVEVPARQYLRIANNNSNYLDLSLMISYQSQLFFEPQNVFYQGKDIFLFNNKNSNILVKINSNSIQKKIFSLYVSNQNLGHIKKGNKLIKFNQQSSIIKTKKNSKYDRIWEVAPQHPVSTIIQGKAQKIILKTTIDTSNVSVHSKWLSYQISVFLNGKPWKNFSSFPKLKQNDALLYKNCYYPILHTQYYYLDVPEGSNKITISSNNKIFAQLLKNKFLNLPIDEKSNLSSIKQCAKIDNALSDIEQKSLNNNHQENITQNVIALLQNKDLINNQLNTDEFLYRINSLLKKYSFYKNLRPIRQSAPLTEKFAFITTINKSIDDISSASKINSFSEFNLNDNFQKFASGFFTKIPKEKNAALQYIIMDNQSYSKLRMNLMNKSKSNSKIWVQFDNQLPISYAYMNDVKLTNAQKQSYSLEKISLLNQVIDSPIQPSFRGYFNSNNLAAPLYVTNEIILNIPDNITKVRVWKDDNSEIEIALSYSKHKIFKLPEESYLSYIQKYSSRKIQKIFFSGLNHYDKNHKFSLYSSKNQLNNHWLPIYTYIHRKSQNFKENITNSPDKKLNLWSKSKTKDYFNQGESFFEKKQWVLAIEHLSSVVQHGYKYQDLYEKSTIFRIKSLINYGMINTAITQLKGLILFSNSKKMQEYAITTLSHLYNENQQQNLLVSLYATLLIKSPTVKNLERFSKNLFSSSSNNINQRYAMDLYLLLNNNERDYKFLTKISYQLSNWYIFDQSVNKLPKQAKYLWQGHKAQKQGFYIDAINYWQKAGAKGRQLIILLKQGVKLFNSLSVAENNSKLEDKLQYYWNSWANKIPYNSSWRILNNYPVKNYGGYLVRNDDTNENIYYYYIDPQKTLKFNIATATKLRFEVKRIFNKKDQQTDNKEWFIVHSNKQKNKRYLIKNSNVNKIYNIVANPNIFVSHSSSFIYNSTLNESLTLKTKNHGALVKIYVSQKDNPLSILSTLQFPIKEMVKKVDLFDIKNINIIEDCKIKNTILNSEVSTQWNKIIKMVAPISLDKLFQKSKLSKNNVKLDHNLNEQDAYYKLTNKIWDNQFNKGDIITIVEDAIKAKTMYPYNRKINGIYNMYQNQLKMILLSKNNNYSNIVSHNGMSVKKITEWHPSSTYLRIKKAMVNATNSFSLKLIPNYDISLDFVQNTELEITFTQHNLPYTELNQTIIQYSTSSNTKPNFLTIPANSSKLLKIKIKENDQLLLKVIEGEKNNGIMEVRIGQTMTKDKITQNKKQILFSSSRENPIQIYSNNLSILRVHEYANYKENMIYYKVLEKGYNKIYPKLQAKNIQMKMFVLDEHYEDSVLHLPKSFASIKKAESNILNIDNYVINKLGKHKQNKQLNLNDLIVKSKDIRTTYNAYMLLNPLINEDEDIPINLSSIEIGGKYRYYNKKLRQYYRTDILNRFRSKGNSVRAVKQWLSWHPLYTNWSFHLYGGLYMQKSNLDNASLTSSLAKVSVRRSYNLSNRFINNFDISILQRIMSVKKLNSAEVGYIAPSIFTKYKKDHRQQIILTNISKYRFKPNQELYLKPKLTSNDKFNLFDVDNLQLSIGYNYLFKQTVEISPFVTIYHTRRDDHRAKSDNRVRLETVFKWRKFDNFSKSWYIKSNIYYDSKTKETQMSLLLSKSFRNNSIRNYRLSEINFRSLYK